MKTVAFILSMPNRGSWDGEWLAITIENGESQTLHDLADALNRWKRHKPYWKRSKPERKSETDILRECVIGLDGMFSGKPIMGIRKGRLVRIGTFPQTAVRDVIANAECLGVKTEERKEELASPRARDSS